MDSMSKTLDPFLDDSAPKMVVHYYFKDWMNQERVTSEKRLHL